LPAPTSARDLQVGSGLLDLVLGEQDPAIGDLCPGIGAREFVRIGDASLGPAGACRGDPRAAGVDP